MPLDRSFTETAAIRSQLGAIFVSLELSRSTWLVTSLWPGGGEKLSKRAIEAGDVSALLARLAELRGKALARTGTLHPIIVIEEAGLDGFWLHRVLEEEGCESHVVDPASIAAPRRRRRAKTDRLDGPRRSCARCSPSSAANLGSARWRLRPRPKRRTSGGSVASAAG
jgi:transposase